MVQYAYTILYVEDVAKSIDFYIKAFDFKQELLTPEHDYGEIQTGTTTLAFANKSLAKTNLSKGFQESHLEASPFGIEMAFTTKEMEHYVDQAVKAGATLIEPIKVKPWGQSVAYLRDIDGFLIELCTPMN